MDSRTKDLLSGKHASKLDKAITGARKEGGTNKKVQALLKTSAQTGVNRGTTNKNAVESNMSKLLQKSNYMSKR